MLHKPWLLLIYFDFLNFFSKGIPDQPALGGCSTHATRSFARGCRLLPLASWVLFDTSFTVPLFPTVEYEAVAQQECYLDISELLTVLLTMNQGIFKHATRTHCIKTCKFKCSLFKFIVIDKLVFYVEVQLYIR